MNVRKFAPATCLVLGLSMSVAAQGQKPSELFRPIDVFGLEYASDPQVSPDGTRVVYVRNHFDIMQDKKRANLWVVAVDGGDHRPLTTGNRNDGSPRWSPDGKRLMYRSNADGTSQVYVRWMDTGQTAKVTQLTQPANGFVWSRDGKQIAFAMHVPLTNKPMAKMPKAPKGAKWAPKAKVITKLKYRSDGNPGFVADGFWHVFVVPADGGTPRQLTKGNYHHRSPAWSANGDLVYISANRREDAEHAPIDTEIFEITVANRSLRQITDRRGPDTNPIVSPNGRMLAYQGYDDKLFGHHTTRIYIRQLADGGETRCLTQKLDRSVAQPVWVPEGEGLIFRYADKGDTKIAFHNKHEHNVIASSVGGATLGRPYASGSFSACFVGKAKGGLAYTGTSPSRPAEVWFHNGDKAVQLTRLNEDLLGHKKLGAVEEFWCESSYDKRKIQGWIVKPPDFDKNKKYPLILEIHGGPFANYGPRFSVEMQLYAAAGYVVVYTNPRGSTSYGNEFANLIHHKYPGNDYDDLMSCVNHVSAKGYIDRKRLCVTGGSGGGVLTSWIIGKTNRFAAAVVAKPVINWYSFVLTADGLPYFHRYWFPGFPWDHPKEYLDRSPISLVGNVKTPTMLLTGEVDYRTPMSESEQYYNALKLLKIPAALVRIPDASHGIARRPSHLIAKVAHVLAWFEKHAK